MILIGSRALSYYVELNRKLHDWDFLMTEEEMGRFDREYSKFLVKSTPSSNVYDINGEIVEIKSPALIDETDWVLVKQQYPRSEVITPFGNAILPNIELLYLIKKSTAEVIDEPKHQHDALLIESMYTFSIDNWFYKRRLEETRLRQEKSQRVKYDFFHKYHIPEYVLHDRLHEIIADLLDINLPTYQRITSADVAIAQELFEKLSHDQKISLMVEECLVLNLERWFIPQMVENGINYRLIDKFYNNNEAMPTYHILKHVCITGLKGEAEYITSFARSNFFEIEQKWIEAKEKIHRKKGFPSSFFSELFQIRKRYLNGEKVASV